MANNVTREQHLEALANAIKDYADSKLANISEAELKLDTVPSTVEGAMWLDNSSKKLAVRHNNRIYRLPFEPLAEITAVNVAPSSVDVMQGQSATATVSAVGNEAVTGLSYGLSGAPTWITISDDVILIQPSDNDIGVAQVEVYAQDTGSDAMSSAILRAEAKLRPIIESLSVIPPAVTIQQGQSAVATVSAVANEAVTGLSYSLNGASSWVNLNGDYIYVTPTDNDLGTNTVDIIAYDTNSSASASAQFVATIKPPPFIGEIQVRIFGGFDKDKCILEKRSSPGFYFAYAEKGQRVILQFFAEANAGVERLRYEHLTRDTWVQFTSDDINIFDFTIPDSVTAGAKVAVQASDTGSDVFSYGEILISPTILPEVTDISLNAEPVVFDYKYDDGYYSQNNPIQIAVTKRYNYTGNVTLSAEGRPVQDDRKYPFSLVNGKETLFSGYAQLEPANPGEGVFTIKATGESGTTFSKQVNWIRTIQ